MTPLTYASTEELRTKLSLYIGRVQFGDEHVIVWKYRRPAAVLIGYEEYQKLCKKQRKTKKEAK